MLPPPIPPPFPTVDEHMENVEPNKEKDMSDIETDDIRSDGDDESLSVEERLALALSCRDEGNRKLKEGDVDGAIKVYQDGISKLKKLSSNGLGTDLSQSAREAKLALYLNLSLCQVKQNLWIDAISSASFALQEDPDNVKGLFRRGLARSRLGYLEEAKEDLLKACRLDVTNAEARKVLAQVKQLDAEARSRDRQAFGGLFKKVSEGFYDDREKQLKEERDKQERQRKEEMRRYEDENKDREAKGVEPIKSFDEWKQMEEKKEAKIESKKEKGDETLKTQTKSITSNELDEEDQKILSETKKMGYCYFNRKLDEEEQKLLKEQNKPQKLQIDEKVEDVLSDKALSSWNSKGTTYEEKDCSSWAKLKLKEILTQINTVKPNSEDQEMHLKRYLDLIKTKSPSIIEVHKCAAPIAASSISVTETSNVDGDAQVIVLRASKRFLYDFGFNLKWTASVSTHSIFDSIKDQEIDLDMGKNMTDVLSSEINDSESVTYSGVLTFSDVSSASSTTKDKVDWLKDAKISMTSRPLQKFHNEVLSYLLNQLKEEIYSKVQLFETEFKAIV